MEQRIKTRIEEIIQSGFETPNILKKVLADEQALIEQDQQNRDVLGLVYVDPEYIFMGAEKVKSIGALLILASTTGLIAVREGLDQDPPLYGGYQVKLIPYSKILCAELDCSMLLGQFKVYLGTSAEPDLNIKFDSGSYLEDFQELLKIIRQRTTAIEQRLN